MRYKAFTLVEILVASMIFMIVVVVSITAFGMVKRSNIKADDLRLTNQCARQIEDYIGSQIRSSNNGKRIMGIAGTSSYTFQDLGTSFVNYPGLALFKDNGKYTVIYKTIDGNFSTYRTKDVAYTNEQDVTAGKSIALNPASDSTIAPQSCSAFTAAVPEYPDYIVDAAKPFQVRKTGRDGNTIEVILKDAVYHKDVGTQKISLDNKSFSSIFLRVTNSLNNL